MAFTVTPINTVFGNKNTKLLKITADGAEANVASGFNVIEWMSVGKPHSMATGAPYVHFNANSSGTAANGTIGVSGVSAGAELYCLVFGR
jgi:hypothetical protein